MAWLTLLCPSRRILSSQLARPDRPGFFLLYGRFRITPATDAGRAGYFFDTSVASVEETTLAIDRRELAACDLGRVSCDDGRLQLTCTALQRPSSGNWSRLHKLTVSP